jgi:iron complex outermembrane receptor protein
MPNKLSSLILLLMVVSSTSAQSLLKGKVSDSEGNPLVGVNVFLYQNKTGTVSQQDGIYQISIPSNLKLLTLEYTYIGYRAQSKTIDLTNSPNDEVYTLDVLLFESQLELQEITVIAGFVKEQDAVSYPIETMMKKEIVSSGEVTFSRALARTPGVYFSRFGIGGGQPVIRGLSNTNLILLNNGIKQEVFQFSSNHPFLIDEFTASHVEIIKGPASLQYGSDAVGGVINVVREHPAQSNSIEGDFITHYYTNTSGYLNSLGIKGSIDKFFFGVRGSSKSHKDFSDGNGDAVGNTRINEKNITLNSGFRTGYGIFSVNYNNTNAKYGVQNGPQINLFANPEASTLLTEQRKNQVWYQDLKNHLISSNNSVFLGKNTLEFDLGYQVNARELVAGGINAQQELLAPTVVSMQLNTFTYNPKINIPYNGNNLVFGVNGASVENDADESKPNVPMPDAKINDIGLYAIGDFLLKEKLTLTTGLRYDYRNMKSFPVPTAVTDRFEIDNTYKNVNGSFGFTYNFSESQFLKANLARGFRSPNLPELTQNGIHAGRYERGNPDMSAQSNYQIDFNYHLHTSWITLDIALTII